MVQRWGMGLLLVGLLAACSGSTPSPSTVPSPTVTRSKSTHTATVSPTATTQSIVATIAPTVAPTAVPTVQMQVWPSTALRPDNATLVAELAAWGKGSIRGLWALDTGQTWIVRTPADVYLYRVAQASGEAGVVAWEEFGFVPGVLDMTISPDEQLLATARPDATVRLWSLADASPMRDLAYEVGRPKLPAFFPPEVDDEVLKHFPAIGTMVFAPNGETLAVAYRDGVVGVWVAEEGLLVHRLEHSVVPASGTLAYTPDSRFLVTAGAWEDVLAVWELDSGNLLWRLPNAGWLPIGRQGDFSPFSPDGSLLASANLGGGVVLRRTRDGTVHTRFGTGLDYVLEVSFTPDGEMLVIVGGRSVGEWDTQDITQFRRVSDGTLLRDEDIPRELIETMGHRTEGGFGPIPESVVVEGIDQAGVFSCGIPASGHFCELTGLKVVSDRTLLAWGGDQTQVFWWKVTEASVGSMPLSGAHGVPVGPSPDGGRLLVCSEAGLDLVDMSDGSLHRVKNACRGPSSLVPGTGQLITSESNRLELVSSTDGQRLGGFSGHQYPISRVAVTHDGLWVASGSESPDPQRGPSEIFLWRLDPRSRVRTIDWWGSVLSLAFSPDGSFLAAGNSSGSVRVWSVEDGRLLHTLDTDGLALAFSPDGSLLATGGWDGMIRLWSVNDGAELAVLDGHAEMIVGLEWLPDGTALVSASRDGTVRLWGIP